MKRIFILFLVIISMEANSQNEFAATSFYNEFNKIYADAQEGFVKNKGTKRISEYEELVDEHKAKWMLPLADSGKIVFPASGFPYVIYYFEPSKTRLKVDQRGAYLRDAVATAFDKPLYTISETKIINNFPYTDTWFFTEQGEFRKTFAIFRQTIYNNNGKFYLSFQIRGKKPL
ncbi:MAG: hypothetical protein IPQ25_13460 [Chitinophagaceae bacterium]|nr:hypothetical protein [Chitinophagaceae bacterium]HQV60608.1 hypothetical protein [Chitinophagaceae bacterium]HQV85000.1 hypothetical protein [Chitinophagaceae bacterium]HQX71532.1 hypothetical protein [Chitinophagaceae bacterium]HQZ75754.1 hypothetical protein [Chitinophagaceae bacterium]